MKTEEVIDLVQEYQKVYRNPNLYSFEISKKYYLGAKDNSVYGWHNIYPFAYRCGVYLFINEENEVIYIGKTSDSFGKRFATYFRKDENGNCFVKHSWHNRPQHIVAIAVPDDSKFESASLEEFLLSLVKTSDNTSLNR